MSNVGDGTPVGDAWDDRLRLRAQETLQPSSAVVWSAQSDQLLNSRNGSQEWRSILCTACTTRFVMAFTMSNSSVTGGARTRLLQRCAPSGDEYRRPRLLNLYL